MVHPDSSMTERQRSNEAHAPTGHDAAEPASAFPPFRYRVGGMDCASCAKTIEKGIEDLDGIAEVRVNFTTETIEGRGRVSADALRQRVEALGYRIVDAQTPARPPAAPAGLRGFVAFLWRQPTLRLALV